VAQKLAKEVEELKKQRLEPEEYPPLGWKCWESKFWWEKIGPMRWKNDLLEAEVHRDKDQYFKNRNSRFWFQSWLTVEGIRAHRCSPWSRGRTYIDTIKDMEKKTRKEGEHIEFSLWGHDTDYFRKIVKDKNTGHWVVVRKEYYDIRPDFFWRPGVHFKLCHSWNIEKEWIKQSASLVLKKAGLERALAEEIVLQSNPVIKPVRKLTVSQRIEKMFKEERR